MEDVCDDEADEDADRWSLLTTNPLNVIDRLTSLVTAVNGTGSQKHWNKWKLAFLTLKCFTALARKTLNLKQNKNSRESTFTYDVISD